MKVPESRMRRRARICTFIACFCLISFPGTDKISDITVEGGEGGERGGGRGVIKSGTTEERNFNNTTLSSSRACLEEASLLAQNGRGPIYYSGGTQRTPNGPDVAHRRKLREPRTIFLQKLQRPRRSTPVRPPSPLPLSLPRPSHTALQRRDIAHFIKHYDNVCMERRV